MGIRGRRCPRPEVSQPSETHDEFKTQNTAQNQRLAGESPGFSEESCLSAPKTPSSPMCSASGFRLAKNAKARWGRNDPKTGFFCLFWGLFARKTARKYGIAQNSGMFLNGTSRGDTNSSRTLTQAQPWTSNRSNKSST
jgi:hypothetical protein